MKIDQSLAGKPPVGCIGELDPRAVVLDPHYGFLNRLRVGFRHNTARPDAEIVTDGGVFINEVLRAGSLCRGHESGQNQ